MSPQNDIITATQSPTVRVSVDDASRREAVEPIGRSFADLLNEVRPKDTAGRAKPAADNARTQPESSSGDYLVVNASLSAPPQQTAGLLQQGVAATPVLAGAAQVADTTSPAAASTEEVSVDTSALFLPPDPNQPAQVTASILSTGFGLASWPPPETPAAIASVLTANTAGQGAAQPVGNVSVDAAGTIPGAVADDAATTIGAGPGANRSATKFLGAEQTQPQSASATATASASASGNAAANPAGATPQPGGPIAQSAAQSKMPGIDIATLQPAGPFSSDSTALQPMTASQPGSATTSQSPTAATHAAPQTLASAPAATVQIYARFIERFDGRSQQYQVRLDPPELGRVNVRIEINSDNRVHAVLATHDSAALSDLIRGQRALEQALADAGIDLADGGLQFQLTDRDGGDFASASDPDNSFGRTGADARGGAIEAETNPATASSQHVWSRGRVNIVA